MPCKWPTLASIFAAETTLCKVQSINTVSPFKEATWNTVFHISQGNSLFIMVIQCYEISPKILIFSSHHCIFSKSLHSGLIDLWFKVIVMKKEL